MKQRFWWFQGDSVAELAKRLAAAGPEARLEVRIEDKDAMYFTVVVPGAAVTEGGGEPPINDSHVCPPICPE